MKSLQYNVHSIPNKDFTHENSRIIPQPTTNFSLSLQSAKVYRLSPIHLANVLSLARAAKQSWMRASSASTSRPQEWISLPRVYIHTRKRARREDDDDYYYYTPSARYFAHARTHACTREREQHASCNEGGGGVVSRARYKPPFPPHLLPRPMVPRGLARSSFALFLSTDHCAGGYTRARVRVPWVGAGICAVSMSERVRGYSLIKEKVYS